MTRKKPRSKRSVPSSERRVTLSPGVYGVIKALADQNGVTVSDIVNEALAAQFSPYSAGAETNTVAPTTPSSPNSTISDAAVDSDF